MKNVFGDIVDLFGNLFEMILNFLGNVFDFITFWD
jgi:hypothetical protein